MLVLVSASCGCPASLPYFTLHQTLAETSATGASSLSPSLTFILQVRRVEKYGVFVELSRSRVSGLAHISQVSQGFVKDLTSHYTPGQAVTVRVLSVDKESNKVSLSMKPELLVGDEDGQDGLANGHAEGSGVDGKGKKGVAQAADFDDEILDAMEVEESEEDADDSDLDIAEGESGGLWVSAACLHLSVAAVLWFLGSGVLLKVLSGQHLPFSCQPLLLHL